MSSMLIASSSLTSTLAKGASGTAARPPLASPLSGRYLPRSRRAVAPSAERQGRTYPLRERVHERVTAPWLRNSSPDVVLYIRMSAWEISWRGGGGDGQDPYRRQRGVPRRRPRGTAHRNQEGHRQCCPARRRCTGSPAAGPAAAGRWRLARP